MRGVVHGEHGWDVGDPRGTSRKRLFVRRFCSRWIREFTCVSRDQREWLTGRVRVKQAVTQIYNGVDTDRCAPAGDAAETRAELGLPLDAFVVGAVGRLDPIKNHPHLFEAFARLREVRPDARLIVAGEGPELSRLESLAGPGISLLGNRPDIPRLLRAMDVFALVSRNEGISNTILEAMSSALPCLVTSVGGNPELVEDGRSGRLVAPGDVDAMADSLIAYAGDPELCARHGDAARVRVLERFSISSMVSGYEAVWGRVAEAERGR